VKASSRRHTALIVIGLCCGSLCANHRRVADAGSAVVAGAVTLEICVLIGLPLNFANIVALPLLLGVGVAFKIYYVTAWRSGRNESAASSLTRAIFFQRADDSTAFGSLWLSSHPGTASHGQAVGALARHDAGRGAVVPASANG